MSVGAQQIECPACGAVVDVTLGVDRTIVAADVGHSDADSDVNQLCTDCLEKIHVTVE